jgi:dissimilatory sulfite reductase (desulfoviridin) alpha/beta subunit
MVQHKFDTAKLVRWIGGPHTADYRYTKKIIEIIAESVNEQTLPQLARIFTSGSPTICQATATDANLQSYIEYKNHPTIEKKLVENVQDGI